MTDEGNGPRSRAEVLERIERDRQALLQRLGNLDESTLTDPGPADGWSIKDHVAHLAAWERYLAALLTGGNRWTDMGLAGAPTGLEEAEINDAIYEQNADLPLAQVYADWDAAHTRVLDALNAMSDDDLMLPFSHFVPDATGEGASDPVVGWVNGNTWGHYAEHAGWIRIALTSRALAELPGPGDEPQTVRDVVATAALAQRSLRDILDGLDDVALSAPHGPDGWAIKDHLLHLAAWERGVAAMLEQRDRWSAMGLTDAQAEQTEDFNAINALIFEASRGQTAQEALVELEAAQDAMRSALEGLSDTDLVRPYDSFVSGAADPEAGPPIVEIINGNTWGHYAEHIGWIADALSES